MILLDGKSLSQKIKHDIKYQVDSFKSNGKRPPHLVAILIGENPASQTYVTAKKKSCEEIGFDSTVIKFPDTISQNKLINEIEKINLDDEIDGLIVQLPLPDHIDPSIVISTISREKNNIVFLLWGNYAKEKAKLIDEKKHLILNSGHPSPLSANRGGWFGNKHFSLSNQYLEEKGIEKIIW